MELLENATAKFIIKCDRQLFCYQVRHSLMQIATIATNCDTHEVRDDYYKLRQYWEAILLGMPDGKVSLAF